MSIKWLRSKICRDERGATIVEFALVFPVFLMFVFAIMQLGAYFFVAARLQNSINEASRQIRIGTSQASGSGTFVDGGGNTVAKKDYFRQLVCNSIKSFMFNDCMSHLIVDVRSYNGNFNGMSGLGAPDSQAASGSCLAGNNNGVLEEADTCYDGGSASSAVIARAYYKYDFAVPWIGYITNGIVRDASKKTATISMTTAFRNEPYN